MNPSRVATSLGGALLVVVSQGAPAAAFGLIEHGASGLGNAYAGGAAAALDPSVSFFNPAGMTRLPGVQVAGAVLAVIPSIELDNQGSSRSALAPIPSGPLTGPDGGNAGVTVALPNLYYTHQISDRLTAGLAVDAPFGLETEYDDDWVGRYHAIKSDLVTVNINPALAIKLSDSLSLGAGVSAMYADVELTRDLDACALARAPGRCDLRSKVTGDDWGFGFNLGLLWSPVESTRLGLSYRSRVKQRLEGEGRFDYSPATPAAIRALLESRGLVDGLADNTTAKADLTLPDSLSVGFYHALGPEWAVMGDVTWTQWSLVDSVVIEFGTGAESTLDLNYEDSLRYGLGVTYNPPGRWTWRAGLAYDEEPVRSERTRTPRLPGNDRLWLALGAGYAWSKDLTFDIGYAHLFVDDTHIRNTVTDFNGAVSQTLVGEYELAVDIVGVQATWRLR
jgi:long-chain fatty acid transport protein